MLKRLNLMIALIFCLIINGFSQDYNIHTLNGQTISTCSGNFYDGGGLYGNYSNNSRDTITFCPSSPNSKIKVVFNSFAIYADDFLRIYDGNSITPTNLIGSYNNVNPISQISASDTNSSGCLTFVFFSNISNNLPG